ncbi:MAG: lipoyl(octanoyl) transferase LipB [Solirubrobacterales bacterium]
MSELWIVECGLVPYEGARAAQRALEGARRRDEVPDTLLLLEHPPVYTRGRRSEAAELPMGDSWYEAQGIEVRETDRGGRVTYHGPGQLVAYPVSRLRGAGSGLEVHGFVRLLEEVSVGALGDFGVGAGTVKGLTGVWTAGGAAPPAGAGAASVAAEVLGGELRKIGSIGIHVSRGVSTHGLAINVENDLQPFEWIVPCGIEGCRMTSVRRELGGGPGVEGLGRAVAERLAAGLGLEPAAVAAADLARRVEGLDALARAAVGGALR